MITTIAFLKAREGMSRDEFVDAATRRRWLSLVLAPGSGVAEDEARFLDRSRTRSFIVDERVSGGAAPGR